MAPLSLEISWRASPQRVVSHTMNDSHVQANRTYWDDMADDWVAAGERSWAADEPFWGIWALPESCIGMLPEDMSGMTTIELGCGTGYVSGWMARRGAITTGIDNSSRQLETAKRLASEHSTELSLIHGNAENVPLPDASFDFAISEYGAAIWCDPYLWIPEAHRLLKPGGQLNFLGNHPLALLTTPLSGAESDTTLHRPWFGMHTFDWRDVEIDPGGVEFNLSIADWLALFREYGFEVLDYQELQAPPEATGSAFSSPAEWSKQWPAEQVWKLRKI